MTVGHAGDGHELDASVDLAYLKNDFASDA
jgi:hypothetical protein